MNGINDIKNNINNIISKYLSDQNTYQIAEHYNTYPSAINRLLRRYNIRLRTNSEVVHYRQKNDYLLSNNMINKLNGWLLGDGSLQLYKYQAMFEIVSKHEEYIKYIAKLFNNTELSYKVKSFLNNYPYNPDKKLPAFKLRTRSSLQLGEMYKTWYPNGVKTVPANLSLNKDIIKIWIMDDGSLSKTDGRLSFATHGFLKNDCEYLANEINKFIEESCAQIHKDTKYYKVVIPRRFTKKLLHLIGNCEVRCFDYKWNIKV